MISIKPTRYLSMCFVAQGAILPFAAEYNIVTPIPHITVTKSNNPKLSCLILEPKAELRSSFKSDPLIFSIFKTL